MRRNRLKRRILPLIAAGMLVISLAMPVMAEDEIVFDDYVTEDGAAVESAIEAADDNAEDIGEADLYNESEYAESSDPAGGDSYDDGNYEDSYYDGDEYYGSDYADGSAESGEPAVTYTEEEVLAENTDGDDTYISNNGTLFQIPRVDITNDRIFDFGGMFTEEEKADLQKRAEKAQKSKKDADIVVMTSYDVPTDSYYSTETTMKYAEQFLMDNGFKEDALIFIIDMNNRVLWTAGHGKYAQEKYVDFEEDVYNGAMDYARNGDYYGAARTYLDKAYKLDNIGYALIPTPLSIIGSAILAFFGIGLMNVQHSKSQPSKATVPRISPTKFRNLGQSRTFLGTAVTRRHISRDTGGGGSSGGGGFTGGTHSGGGFSGGGGSFSGGGGHF